MIIIYRAFKLNRVLNDNTTKIKSKEAKHKK